MKKKKVLIIVIALVAILVAFIIAYIIHLNTTPTNVEDFYNLRELLEYYGCTYKSTKNSSEEGYTKDVYMEFKVDPVDSNGNTQQTFYEQIISLVEAKMENQNIRMIDESRDLTVRINYNEETKTANYTINGYANFFKYLLSAISVKNSTETNDTALNIASNELNAVINANWVTGLSNLGKNSVTCSNYDTYSDKNVKVRSMGSEIYNLIFAKSYQGQVFNGVTTGMTTEQIKSILGKPTFEDTTVDAIGYKNESFYAFFHDGEISMYRVKAFDESKNKEFAKLFTKLNTDGDYNQFLLSLTSIYSDYNYYTQETSLASISYPLEGFTVTFGKGRDSGLTLYQNYQGAVTESVTFDQIKNENQMPLNTYLKVDVDAVWNAELTRIQVDDMNRNPYDDMFAVQSKDYTATVDGNQIKFYSRTKEGIDSQIVTTKETEVLLLVDSIFVYGIEDKGIYAYNANTRQNTQIVSGTGSFQIEKVENTVIYYDGTTVTVNIN